MFEDLNTVFTALKDFLSRIFEIFEIDKPESNIDTSGASDVFEEAKKLFEEIKNLFNK